MSKGEDGVSGRRADGGGGGAGRPSAYYKPFLFNAFTHAHQPAPPAPPPRPPPGAGLFTVRLFNFPEIGL